MKYWIVPSNDSIFRIGDALLAQNGIVHWRMSNPFAVDDVVFIYKTAPENCIRYRMQVIKTGYVLDNEEEQGPFWADMSLFYDGIGNFRYVQFKLIEEYTDDTFSLHHLHEHGLNGVVQSVRECKNQNLLRFLLNPTLVNDDVYDVDYPEADSELYEGALMKVMANRYERNQEARQRCVDLKGYKCKVCGFDFMEHYGEIGKGFIHVHHIVPISSVGYDYQINVEKDLEPVCPNCHYMLHRNDPPYTIEQLKERMLMADNKQGITKTQKRRRKAEERKLTPPNTVLFNVEDDSEVRKHIHNMMEMEGGTMMKNITSECIKNFGSRYPNMSSRAWFQLIRQYVRKVTKLPKLKDDELFSYKTAM